MHPSIFHYRVDLGDGEHLSANLESTFKRILLFLTSSGSGLQHDGLSNLFDKDRNRPLNYLCLSTYDLSHCNSDSSLFPPITFQHFAGISVPGSCYFQLSESTQLKVI